VLSAAAAAPVEGGPRLPLWASCPGGGEPEVAAELAALGWRPWAGVPPRADVPRGTSAGLLWERGSVYGEADLAAVYRTLWAGRTVSRVAWLLYAGSCDSLDELYEVVRGLDLGWLPDAPFAVVPERHGEHTFGSPDIGRVAGAAVIDAVRAATGRRLPVNLDRPALAVRVELAGARLRVGLELVEESLHRRPYQVVRHHAGLKPTVAAILLLLAGWRPHERLLDPMCGAATIPLEAALAALRRPLRLDPPARLATLGLHDPRLAAEVGDALRAAERPAAGLRILGLERFANHVASARRNARAAGLEGVVEIRQGDATTLAGVEGTFDCVVTNPPYGIRAGRPAILDPLYAGALARAAERLAPGGRIVFLTAAPGRAWRAARRAGLRPAGARTLSLGSLDATACLFERA
jgi:tRNA (guanine6-N2)-methyltransferase